MGKKKRKQKRIDQEITLLYRMFAHQALHNVQIITKLEALMMHTMDENHTFPVEMIQDTSKWD